MTRISTTSRFVLALLIILFASSYAGDARWPLYQDIDLSSGFGDFREGRFHAGVDIRTGGRVGRPVLSPVDGYVYRLKTSYIGSGKALYVMGDDEHIYVFYHLDSFAPEIEKALKRVQVAAERYYVDAYLPRDSIRVKEGDRIARSGQTGAGAPHLHFEKRTAENRPINPLTHGFELSDVTRPTITRVGFEMTDETSLFASGSREIYCEPTSGKNPGEFGFESVLAFKRPFGLVVEGFDQMREGGMHQSIYSLSAYLDGRLLYESVLDTLDFETDKAVRLEYDYPSVVEGDKGARRLFHRAGNQFAGSRGVENDRGIIGLGSSLPIGPHTVSIVAKDCFGNTTRVTFDILWTPPDGLYSLDTIVSDEQEKRTEIFFRPNGDHAALEIDSLFLITNRYETWQPVENAEIVPLESGRFKAALPIKSLPRTTTLCVAAKTKHGCYLADEPFNGLRRRAGKIPQLTLSVLEDGLLVHIGTKAKVGSEVQLALYYQDRLLGREYPSRHFDMNNYSIFVPPKPEYARVDRIDVYWSYDTLTSLQRSQEVFLAVVGFEEHDRVVVDSEFAIEIGRENLFKPTFLQVSKDPLRGMSRFKLSSDLYTIQPEALATRKDFAVQYKIPRNRQINPQTGMCWLDKKKDRWVWLDDSKYNNDTVTASSLGGGTFAALYDVYPPKIDNMNIIARRTVATAFPLIEFRLSDTLSGIGDDRNIDIRIDGQWMIPEYDPESEICKTMPVEPLANGEHHLAIIVTDRAGNKTEEYLIFNVNAPEERGSSQ